ncbi:MAG: error-prone DNA polymerase [Rariglobus sp.]
MPNDYVELHAASAFSFLRGASLPEHLTETAAKLGLSALAVLDRDGLFSAPRVYSKAHEHKIHPLVGAEITIEDGSVVPLLVQNRTGYQNLCRLISDAKLNPRSPDIAPFDQAPGIDPHARKRPCFASWSELTARSEGLIALTGDEQGPLLRGWQRNGEAGASAALAKLSAAFGDDRLYVELQRHRVRGEEPALRMLSDLAASRQLPLLATGGVLHATPEQRAIVDVFTCLRHHTTLDAAGRLLSLNHDRHLRSAQAMRDLFHDYPEAIINTTRLADRLDFTLEKLGYEFPDYPVDPGETMDSHLRKRTYEGAAKRFSVMTGPLKEQIEKELGLIAKLGFSGYFLIVWDVCRRCREDNILIQGRGSAANSAVCYALSITAVDPTKHNLLFERFLSEGRIGKGEHPCWPDIDLDLPSGPLREKVIQDVYTRFGRRGAAMVANVVTYRGRGAAREIGKVLGVPDDVLDRYSSLYANGDFPHTLGLEQQLKTSGLPANHPRLSVMVNLCQGINHLPRHLGQHSGGMILCPGRLDTIVPVESATMEGRTIVQWNKDDCENLGLVKIDFLGLGMMAVLQDCQRLCRENSRPFELNTVPAGDEATYNMMCAGDTIGVFQIESRAQMATLPRLQPREFYDVAMAVAIVRPGPIIGGIMGPLMERRADRNIKYFCVDPEVDHLARPVLQRTFGVILFQEQMLALSMEIAGFNGSEAEEMRRALGFDRDDARLIRVLTKLRSSVLAKGYSSTVAEKLVHATETFALYGFPESHAISFALLAYASTWLKIHRPAEFYASLLNHQPMGFYSASTLVQDGRRRKLKVRPACVQHSAWDCTVEGPNVIRIGLRFVKGLRESVVRELTTQRAMNAFSSLADFLRRSAFNASERRALASVGALNIFAGHRRAALWQVEAAWSSEESLFQHAGGLLDETNEADTPLAPMALSERVQADYRTMSLTSGDHPMSIVRDQLPEVWCAADLPLGKTGDLVIIGGSVICRQRPGTAKGTVFISLEDETGVANAIVASALFERFRMVINEEPALRISGRLQSRAGVIHVKAEKIEALRVVGVPTQASHDFK